MEEIPTKDLIEYLSQRTLRFLQKKRLIQFAQILVDNGVRYSFFDLSCAELNQFILRQLPNINRDLLLYCAKLFIPMTTNLNRCDICKKFMEEQQTLPCEHNVHKYCFVKGQCPICIEHILDLYPMKARL